MKKSIIKKGVWLSLSFLGLGFVACDDDNIHDFNKQTGAEPANFAYIADSVFTYPIFWSLDDEYTGPDTIIVEFPIHLTEAAKSETKITFDVDNELIEVYNTAHGTSYYPIDAKDLTLTPNNATVTVEEGKTQSVDSVSIAVTRPMRGLDDIKGYLIPLKIRSYKGTDVGIDYQKRHSYIAINVVYENLVQTPGITAVNTAYYENLNDAEFKLSSLYPIQGQSDAKIQLSVKNDQASAFNSMMGTNFQLIPSGLPSTYEVNMSKGTTEATFNLAYTGNTAALTDPRGYVVPLEVTSVTGERILIPEGDAKMFYAIIYANATEFVANESEIGGTKVTDRSKYNMVRFIYRNGTPPKFATGSANGLFSSKMFAIMPLADALNMTIDLGEEVQNITGFHIGNAMGNGSALNVRTLDVGYATELMYEKGASIELRKEINLLTATPSLPKNCYIKFEKPITARYIHVDNILHNGGSYLGLNNFSIYTQP